GNGPLDVNAFLISNVSGEERSIRFDSRGSSSYSRRISTDGEWAIGAYTLLVKAVDRDGAVFEYDAGVVFFIDADVVTFQFGKVFVDLNISANAEIVLGSSYGASSPVSVHLLLFDDNGTLVGQEDLIPTGSADTWTAVFQLTGIPDTGNIKIQDDLGRTIWSNGTLTLEIEKEPVNIKSHTGPDNNNSTMLMILLLLTALMILMVVVLFAIILMRPKPERYLMPAPPMGVPLPGANERSGLPPVQPPSLPPSSSENTLAQNAVPAHLPPGRELLDGSSYHRPDVKVEENRARSTAGNLVIGTGIPPPSPEHPQTDTSKPTNTGSDLEPSKEDVQNTDGPDSAGDTGQGQQKGEQGPGSRPGLQVPDAEAQQGQG
ncbi:MAG: hypothetical protein U9R75_09690, partial [Candidatus Thermoplasmatota archaeon]|nr:hypothetical protein [Candidatus Thermoplasmatota archaeon]